MKIGIDIDDTLTNIKEELDNAWDEYAKKLGKKINKNEYDWKHDNNGKSMQKKYNLSYEELKYFLATTHEEITSKALPRNNVKEIIDKLKKDGHEIYIITARDSEFHKDPYKLSKDWLEKNYIYYDKIIVNAREKAPVCQEEKIDVFIDDQLNNCMEVSKVGIKTIRISSDEKTYENIVTLTNWNEIYNYIKEME